MGENSAISWTDHTFNPWWGCTKVGPGCDHCYAERFDRRVGGDHWGAGKPRRLVKDWSNPRKWNREAERSGIRPWVFCASMADVFDNEVPAEWRERLWQLMRETLNLNWILVTKRIGNAAKMLPPDWPFPHVGLCITVCNQDEADRDVPKLLATPAAWRGISAEPLLGPIDLFGPEMEGPLAGREPTREQVDGKNGLHFVRYGGPRLDWVIVGGESGPHARPMHPRWATDIRDQCAAAGVSFHFKQRGEWSWIIEDYDWPHATPPNHPDDWRTRDCGVICMRQDGTLTSGYDGTSAEFLYKVGKTKAGRLLDGIEHNGMPPSPSTRRAEG